MRIKKLKFSITDACEGKCEYCYRGPITGKRHLSQEVIANSLESMRGAVQEIHVSGGNPVLHPRFRAILDICASTKVPVKLSANPKLLNEKYRWALSMVDFLSFSLESHSRSLHDGIRGIQGDFDALCTLFAKGLNDRSSIIIVVTKENIADAIQTISLAKSLRPARLKVQLVESSLIPPGRTVDGFLGGSLRTTLVELYQRYGRDPEISLSPRLAVYDNADVLVDRFLAGRIGPSRGEPAHCGYMLSNPHVKENGAVYPCCGVSHDREIGNVYDETLAVILRRHIAEQGTHDTLPYPSCERCVFFSHYNPGAKLAGSGEASVLSSTKFAL
jgi:radical SAM protein with 4Fe4S-binding SPASM domain